MIKLELKDNNLIINIPDYNTKTAKFTLDSTSGQNEGNLTIYNVDKKLLISLLKQATNMAKLK
jgi:hypothetical protein